MTSGMRASQAFRIKAAGFLAAFAILTLAAIARRSKAEARQGISRKSAAEAIMSTPAVACGAISMTARVILSFLARSMTLARGAAPGFSMLGWPAVPVALR